LQHLHGNLCSGFGLPRARAPSSRPHIAVHKAPPPNLPSSLARAPVTVVRGFVCVCVCVCVRARVRVCIFIYLLLFIFFCWRETPLVTVPAVRVCKVGRCT
ncbi:hypothetical protein AMELA_G00172150, partial [Ameiurus melas]